MTHASINRIYRLVFNAATGMYVAVAETARGRGKAGRSSAALLAAVAALGSSAAFAQGVLPTGGVVASGSATISQTSSAMTVNQSSQAAILNWQSFSIGAANSVRFNQPSVSSVALNRVIGNSASEILGSLSANGKVILVNQNGILMGSGAQVDTGRFMASTLNIKDSDFLAGRYIFDIANNTGGVAGNIINNGRINTPSGYTVLMAPSVTNNGYIAARAGTVAIAAGNKVSLDMVGDGLISFNVNQAALNAAVVNTGTIQANGGQVLIKASSANALFDTVINSTGIIRADSIANVNGRIILDGGATGVTQVSGEISAKGSNTGETGGSIAVLGDKVGLFNGAKLDASGDAGGGTVLVGGNWQGGGSERTASRTIVASGATIDVSATGNGNGGTAVVWADGRTDMDGSIKATGAGNGSGGNVETSGKRQLALQGSVNVNGGNTGKGGQWLLDPDNITISNAVSSNLAGGATPFEALNNGNDAIVNAASLGAAITSGATVNVVTNSTTDSLGSITVNSAVTAAGAGTLNLVANRDIDVNAAISSSGAAAMNVNFYAGAGSTGLATIANVGTSVGRVTINAAINTNGGKFTSIDPNAFYITNLGTVNTSSATGGGDVTIKSDFSVNVDGSINVGSTASGGTIRLQAPVISGRGTVIGRNLAAKTNVADGQISLVGIHGITGTVALDATGDVFFKNATSYEIGQVTGDGILTSAVSGITARANTFQPGDVTLWNTVAATTVSQAVGASGVITAPGKMLIVGASNYMLTNTGNNFTNLAGNGYGDKSVVTAGPMVVSGSSMSGNNITLATMAGDITIGALMSVTNTLRIQAAGAVTQSSTANINADALGVRGTSVNLSTAENQLTGTSSILAINASTGVASFNGTYSAFKVGDVAADSLFTATNGVTGAGGVTLATYRDLQINSNISSTNAAVALTTGGNLVMANNTSISAGTGAVSIVNQNAIRTITLASVNAASLTVDAAGFTGTMTKDATKVYDTTIAVGNVVLGVNNLTYTASSNLNTVAGSATYDNKNVGTGKTVTSSNLSITGYNGAASSELLNAGLAFNATSTANITQANVSVTGLTATNKVYDAATAATLGGTAAVAALGTDVLTVGGAAAGLFANKNAGTGKAITVTGNTLGGADAGNYNLVQQTGLAANITAKALTVTGLAASNKVYDTTTAATLAGTGALTGVLGGDTVSVASGTGAFADKNVGVGKTVTVSGVSLGGADAGNYSVSSSVSLTADITKANISVTGLTAANKVYDAGTAVTLGGTAAVAALGTDVLTVGGAATGNFANKNAGTAKAITITGNTLGGTDAGNYNLVQQTRLTANITAKALTVTGLNASNKVYDATTAATLAGTGALTGVLGADVVATNGGAGTFANKDVGNAKAVTVIGVMLNGTDAGNYSVTNPTGLTANITPAALTVTANNDTRAPGTAYSGGNGVAYSGLVGGETAAVLTGALAYSGSSQGASTVGNYVITPAGLTSSNYTVGFGNGTLAIAVPAPAPAPVSTPAPAPAQQQAQAAAQVAVQTVLQTVASNVTNPGGSGSAGAVDASPANANTATGTASARSAAPVIVLPPAQPGTTLGALAPVAQQSITVPSCTPGAAREGSAAQCS